MRAVTLFLSCLVCFCSFPVKGVEQADADSASRTEDRKQLSECSWAGSSQDVVDCIKQLASDSSKKLITTENEILAKLGVLRKESYNGMPDEFFGIAATRFKQAKKDFVLFRKNECDFYMDMRGAARSISRDQRQYSCQFLMNYQRIKQLEDYIEEMKP